MTHTVRRQPRLRAREYERVVESWAESYREREGRGEKELPKIIFVENGNNNLDALREASRTKNINAFEFVSWHDTKIKGGFVARGKGFAEYRSIAYGIKNSRAAGEGGCDMIVKVTGRYFIPSLIDEIARLRREEKDATLIVQGTENWWNMHENDGGVVRSEVVGWKKGREEWIYEGQNEAIGVPMERV
eukprot:CAMPEP_0118636136 /NCGR_PEP_ID=MMETSP0785-20121206/2452_1 /TAXON_ID=91992 /ORGANISM="Bolidomonas pacifica, Strain CCMP 1866" /LENGTH=188 /DNA_ID=CAMNT_0006527223 /DNA_START=55 /DNA_END=618 /DNA_ORIENTATION=-